MSEATTAEPKDAKARLLLELRKYAVVTVYLWCIFQLLGLYRAMVLRENGINAWEQGFAIVNALVFGKVILIGQLAKLGKRLQAWPIIYGTAANSLAYAILLLIFHVIEHGIKALIQGKPPITAITDIGGVPLGIGIATIVLMFFFALMPFFMVQEFSRVLGERNVFGILFGHDKERYKLVRD